MNHQSNNSKIIDPFLLKVLEQHRGQSDFTDILRSIQNEQNEIVDYDIEKNTIAQGCAGSGKTMILFHRLANILYNIETSSKKITANRIAVIIPNNNFRNYIKNLTWSLGVDNIRTYTMDEYLLSKVEDVTKRIFKSERSETIHSTMDRKKSSYALLIRRIRDNMDGDTSENEEVVFKEDVAVSLLRFITEYEGTLRRMITERIIEREKRIERKRPGKDPEHEKWLKESLEKIRKYREDSIEQFVSDYLDGKLNRDYMIGFLNTICAKEELSAYKPGSDDLVMIDEGQDYGYLEYVALKAISPDGIFNIYGDIDQKIYERGVAEWDSVRELFDAHYFELNQDYRNSSQIIDFVNKTFNKNILSVGFSTKDVEEVDLNKLPVYLEYEDKILKHSVAIITEKPEIYRGISESIKILTVKQIKGLEFDAVFVSPEISNESDNYRYVSYTRALDHLYILK